MGNKNSVTEQQIAQLPSTVLVRAKTGTNPSDIENAEFLALQDGNTKQNDVWLNHENSILQLRGLNQTYPFLHHAHEVVVDRSSFLSPFELLPLFNHFILTDYEAEALLTQLNTLIANYAIVFTAGSNRFEIFDYEKGFESIQAREKPTIVVQDFKLHVKAKEDVEDVEDETVEGQSEEATSEIEETSNNESNELVDESTDDIQLEVEGTFDETNRRDKRQLMDFVIDNDEDESKASEHSVETSDEVIDEDGVEARDEEEDEEEAEIESTGAISLGGSSSGISALPY